MILRSFAGKWPVIHPTAWIAENAVIIGDVTIGARANIWYNVVIRADTNTIRIGDETNIQDGSVLHAETIEGPCIIGKRVTIGHIAIVHGCIVEDETVIGMGSKVLSYAKIGRGALVAAGALVREHMIVPPEMIVAGVPAKERGKVTDDMKARFTSGCDQYLALAEEYRKSIST